MASNIKVDGIPYQGPSLISWRPSPPKCGIPGRRILYFIIFFILGKASSLPLFFHLTLVMEHKYLYVYMSDTLILIIFKFDKDQDITWLYYIKENIFKYIVDGS